MAAGDYKSATEKIVRGVYTYGKRHVSANWDARDKLLQVLNHRGRLTVQLMYNSSSISDRPALKASTALALKLEIDNQARPVFCCFGPGVHAYLFNGVRLFFEAWVGLYRYVICPWRGEGGGVLKFLAPPRLNFLKSFLVLPLYMCCKCVPGASFFGCCICLPRNQGTTALVRDTFYRGLIVF